MKCPKCGSEVTNLQNKMKDIYIADGLLKKLGEMLFSCTNKECEYFNGFPTKIARTSRYQQRLNKVLSKFEKIDIYCNDLHKKGIKKENIIWYINYGLYISYVIYKKKSYLAHNNEYEIELLNDKPHSLDTVESLLEDLE